MFSPPFRERRVIHREMLMLRGRPKTAREEADSDVPNNRARLSRPTAAILLFLVMLSSPAARAGPTWMAAVVESPGYFSGGSNSSIDINVSPITGTGFGLATFDNGRGVPPTTYGVLLDYQGNTGPENLYVTYASWGYNTSILDPVTLLVYSFPSSPNPPSSITSLPYYPSESLDIPVGDYSSSSCLITLSGPCVLLEAEFDHELGTPYIDFSFSSSVPEPSSWLILGTAMAGLAIFFRHGLIRRRASQTSVGSDARPAEREPTLSSEWEQ